MKNTKSRYQMDPVPLKKTPTGIAGIDEVTGGGLPQARTTIFRGGSGSGKSMLALQILVNGAHQRGEPGIFVSFEETPEQIRTNAASFGWGISALERDKLLFLDARATVGLMTSGEFELSGLLASLAAIANQMSAKLIVLDSLDILLSLLDNAVAERAELRLIKSWLEENSFLGIITTKSSKADLKLAERNEVLEYMSDCVIEISHDVSERISKRSLRILKYRGSSFSDSDCPFVFGPQGIEVSSAGLASGTVVASTERVSSGVPRLDTMLDGGFFRASTILISGRPGTAKSTLAGALVNSFCGRGEKALYYCFDEFSSEVLRNLASVNIQLSEYVDSKLLHMETISSDIRNPEEYLNLFTSMIDHHKPKVVVIDPVSAIVRQGDSDEGLAAIHKLVRLAKQNGITLLLTSLLTTSDGLAEDTSAEISTISDAWLHLSYVINGGERNRAVTIVKCRGVAHSNQVRELVLSTNGISVSDVYVSGGNVLMGTARFEREHADLVKMAAADLNAKRDQQKLSSRISDTKGKIEALNRELLEQKDELDRLAVERTRKAHASSQMQDLISKRRGGDKGTI